MIRLWPITACSLRCDPLQLTDVQWYRLKASSPTMARTGWQFGDSVVVGSRTHCSDTILQPCHVWLPRNTLPWRAKSGDCEIGPAQDISVFGRSISQNPGPRYSVKSGARSSGSRPPVSTNSGAGRVRSRSTASPVTGPVGRGNARVSLSTRDTRDWSFLVGCF